LKFSVSAKELQQAIESIQVRGKNLTSKGFSSSTMGEYFYMVLEGNLLSIVNASPIFLAKIDLIVEGQENGETVASATTVVPYLKSFSDNITLSVSDFISITQGTRKASLPRVVNHPSMDALNALMERTKGINWSAEPATLPSFGKSPFEGTFSITSNNFSSCMKNCELVRSGVYKLDFNKETVCVSSQQTTQNSYEETITPNHVSGEAATLEYTGALHNFFLKNQLLNFYVKDEFPLLIVAPDRLIVKAPQSNGD